MATSLKIARRNGHSTFIRWGEAAKAHLRSQGIQNPSEAKIYLDRDGFVSYKGKAVRNRDGTFVPYANAPLTAQGKATAERQASAANKAALAAIGSSHTVSSRQELERRDAERKKIIEANRREKAERERAARERAARERAAREKAERERAAREQAAQIQARKIVPKPAAPTLITSQPTPTPAPRPAPVQTRPAATAARQFAGFRGAATVIDGVTVLFLKPD